MRALDFCVTLLSCQIVDQMFHSSTQKQHWMFKDEEELGEIRSQANLSFCEEQKPGVAVLVPSEELQLLRYYQKKLVELCNLYAPPKWLPLPRTALVRELCSIAACTITSSDISQTTAVTYFKRFYLYTSVMEYHPQDI